MYEVMCTITVADARFRSEVQSGHLQAAYYPVHGLEAVCAGLSVCLDRSDYLVSTYRNLGDLVAKGVSLRAVAAETAGRATGTSKGKGGPMHIQDPAVGLMATTGVVGSGLPIAVGLALAAQLDGDGRVTAVTFGDGATSIGAYHEAANLAALWRLPLVLVCQNNQWAEHTPLAGYAPNPDLAGRAAGYGMASVAVDGFDPIATWRALADAVARAREGGGPTFVECRTYRLSGHAGATDFSYMPAEEVEAAEARDPAPSFRRWLLEAGLATEEDVAEIEASVQATVDDAFDFAFSSPAPEPGEVYEDVFSDSSLVMKR
jgi:pyruvate dehydrogenase E1 component alpha subunit